MTDEWLPNVTVAMWCPFQCPGWDVVAIAPVSSSDFRLDMIRGQPPDTAVISFESARSISCVIVSFTESSTGSSSIVQRLQPSALS